MNICPTTLARYLPRWLADELGMFFFRTLGHDWGEAQAIDKGAQQQCAKCKEWRHYSEVEGYAGKTGVVSWQPGKHPAWR